MQNNRHPLEEAEHREGGLEITSHADGVSHKWVQQGVWLNCSGDSKHDPHGLHIPARYVFQGEDDKGMRFKDTKTGEVVYEIES